MLATTTMELAHGLKVWYCVVSGMLHELASESEGSVQWSVCGSAISDHEPLWQPPCCGLLAGIVGANSLVWFAFWQLRECHLSRV